MTQAWVRRGVVTSRGGCGQDDPPPNSPQTSYIDHNRRDAARYEMDQYYTELQRYSLETQLAHPWYSESEPREEFRGPPSWHRVPQERTLRDELRDIQERNFILRQSQQVMYADVVGLREVPAEIRRPTNRVISLQQTMPYPISHCDSQSVHSVTGDRDDWPDPPHGQTQRAK